MYVPTNVPSTANELPNWLSQEVLNISRSMAQPQPYFRLAIQYKEPNKVEDGMVAFADGSSWNPGSGRGTYCYSAGAWRFWG